MKKDVYEYISKQAKDHIVQRKKCLRTGDDFPIFQSEIDMLDKLSPNIGGKKYSLPVPDLSPKARQINRLMFRNERHFYKKKTVQGNIEISTISPGMGLQTSTFKDYFEGDHSKFSLDYSGDIKQDLTNLRQQSIFPSKLITNMENSDYCNQETDDKNCYLNAGGHFNEDCMYNTYAIYSKWNVDNYRSIKSENIYKSYNIVESNKVFFSQYIENGFNIYFSKDIIGSNNILLSMGIRNGQYIYKNKQYDKESRTRIYNDYLQKIKTHTGLEETIAEYNEFILNQPQRNLYTKNSEASFGDEVTNTKQSKFCSSLEDGENIMYSNIVAYIQDCMDTESVGRSSKLYQYAGASNNTNCTVGTHIMDTTSDSHYCAFSQNGNNLFACLGVNHKKYSILNKTYNEKEYFKLIDEIISDLKTKGLRGKFFLPERSPFPYNDTVAMDYFPITENQLTILSPDKFISDAILDLGGEQKIKIKRRTRNTEINIPDGLDTINAKDLPNSIEDVDDSILQKAIICDKSKRPFRIVKPELSFHRLYGIALPREHPDIRHKHKMTQRPSRELHLAKCINCNCDILTTSSNKNILCETCYKKTIY